MQQISGLEILKSVASCCYFCDGESLSCGSTLDLLFVKSFLARKLTRQSEKGRKTGLGCQIGLGPRIKKNTFLVVYSVSPQVFLHSRAATQPDKCRALKH